MYGIIGVAILLVLLEPNHKTKQYKDIKATP
jgi:hypothetical protein